jgi:3-phenylpropionate/trans-cinnamate dioxygenase ferredoxin component
MSDWVSIVSTEGFSDGEMRAVDGPDRKLLVARVGDEFLVTQEHCPHLGGNLAKGTLEGTVVTCPLHHSQFDLTDGRCVRWTDWKGAVLDVAQAVRHPRPLVSYESKVEEGQVWLGPARPPASSAEAAAE